MKKLFLFLFLSSAVFVNAQTITIGEGTEMSTSVPYNSFYNFSLTEQVYLASEIEFSGYIKAIKFRIAYSYSSESVNDINVYMKNVSRESFSNASDYEELSEENLVFSGEWIIPADTDDWMTIEFDTPFYYNGTDNLLIAIDENDESYAIRYFRCTNMDASALSYYSDTDNPNPLDISSFSGSKEFVNQRANIKLVFSADAIGENNLTESLSVYPNPAKDVIYIDAAEGETISIYDASGRLVMQKSYSENLNISTLPKGIYTVKTTKNTAKFIK